MPFDRLKADIGFLLTEMQNEPEDAHELYLQLKEKLSQMRAYGLPLPADLVQMESDMDAEFTAEREAMLAK